jgi:K+-transporting ATPase ATPase A chain
MGTLGLAGSRLYRFFTHKGLTLEISDIKELYSMPELAQFIFFFLLLAFTTPLLGTFMAKVFQGKKTLLSFVISPIEKLIYKICGIDSSREMHWREYAIALMAFNILGISVVFLVQILQGVLPLQSPQIAAISWHSALNTAVSFVTNTNWQGYAGETTMSAFTQMTALTVQNFVSAATGIAVAVALARGLVRQSQNEIGNFWTDLIRGVLYVLLPLSFVFAIVLIGEGVVQTFHTSVTASTLEGAQQILPMGPAASQVAIKQLGTNGGGFFNANSAHPFENPTPLSNFLQMFAIFLIPAALTFTFGLMVKAKKHGWVLYGTMLTLFIGGFAIALASESMLNPIFLQSGIMEGKEVRFGVFNSIFFEALTTSASCGAINALHSSLSPLAGAIALVNMQIGEVVFGGVGAGLYGMILFVFLTVFIAGLMVGRTPEYLGKKIEAPEMIWVMIAVLAPSVCVLIGTAMSVALPAGLSSLSQQGPHGFSEILYAFTSAAANNGSAFAGLNANTLFYNLLLSVAMFVGRFAVIIPILAVAGSMAAKKYSPPSPGTFEVDTPLFAILLMAVILIVGGLTFFPALALGPLVEHFMMLNGQTF